VACDAPRDCIKNQNEDRRKSKLQVISREEKRKVKIQKRERQSTSREKAPADSCWEAFTEKKEKNGGAETKLKRLTLRGQGKETTLEKPLRGMAS